MKTIKDKHILIASEVAGFPLKEAIKAHLIETGWHVTDVGIRLGDYKIGDAAAIRKLSL